MMISRVLIANRGEIACRIIKTCARLGIKTIAIYSEVDQGALHVQMADEAYALGGSTAQESYLNTKKILDIAKHASVDAIHPGYGFLSENATFALAVSQAGFIYIGPHAKAIEKMGSKDEAKAIMQKAGVPVIPGIDGKGLSTEQLVLEAKKIKCPVMIKASMGGGGKGMRIVEHESDLENAIESAKREALSSFNDDSLLIEKYIKQSRHIEVQVIGDEHGNIVHLFERDCSLQRRHQKVIEQAPAQHLKPNVRKQLHQTAIEAAKAIEYTNAGTIEFLVDEQQNIYFLEMNTRLQVEHPITECITGIDLVQWQLLVAAGEPLPRKQEDIQCKGVAFEARIYAEDPAHDFLPVTGTIEAILHPQPFEARFDTGVQAGDTIGIYYDPMLAKVIVHGQTHAQALRQLHAALDQLDIVGITHNLPFLRLVSKTDAFIQSKIDTHFLSQHGQPLIEALKATSHNLLCPAILALVLSSKEQVRHHELQQSDPFSPWANHDAWQLNGAPIERLRLKAASSEILAIVQHQKANQLFITISEKSMSATISGALSGNFLTYEKDGEKATAQIYKSTHGIHILQDGHSESYDLVQLAQDAKDESSQNTLTAPMPGIITNIWVKAGANVLEGDKLLAMEAMKMEHTVSAAQSGLIKNVFYKVGDQIQQGAQIFEFESHD